MIRLFNHQRFNFIVLTASVTLVSLFALAVNTKTAIAEPNQNAPAVAQDYGLKDTAKAAGLPIGETSPIIIAATIINIILGLVGVLAVILIIYAGFSWMTAAGNEEKITKAKKVLSGAIIGLLIIMASFIISSFVMKNVKEATKDKVKTESFPPGSRNQGESCYQDADCASGLICYGSAYPPGQCQP